MGETAIIAESFASDTKFFIKTYYETLTRFYTCPTGRRDTQASLRHRNFFAIRASGSQGHLEEYGYPRNPLRQDARGEGSEVMTRRLGFEEDTQYQTERGTEEQGPAGRQRDRVGAGPVGWVEEEGPGAGEEPAPSQEPVLDGVGTDQKEPGRSLLVQVL